MSRETGELRPEPGRTDRNSPGRLPVSSRRGPKTPQQRWLMVLRLVISTFLLISLFLVKAHGAPRELNTDWFEPGLGALGLYYLLAVIYYYLPAEGRAAAFNRVAQVLADLSLAICLTLISGGGNSPFSFLFIIAIINGAFLGGIRTALVVATFSAALWGAMVTMQDSGHLANWLPYLAERTEAARAALREKPLRSKYYSLHSHFADPYGDALIVEELAGETVLTPIEGGFDRIWKVSMNDATIQTHQGFRTAKTFPIGEAGIHFDELKAYGYEDARTAYLYLDSGKATLPGYVIQGITVLLAIFIAYYSEKRKRSKSLRSR